MHKYAYFLLPVGALCRAIGTACVEEQCPGEPRSLLASCEQTVSPRSAECVSRPKPRAASQGSLISLGEGCTAYLSVLVSLRRKISARARHGSALPEHRLRRVHGAEAASAQRVDCSSARLGVCTPCCSSPCCSSAPSAALALCCQALLPKGEGESSTKSCVE